MIRQRSRQGVRVRGRARRDYVVLSTWAEGPTVRVNYEGRCKLAEYCSHRSLGDTFTVGLGSRLDGED